jgi:hypothetical protein
MQHNWTTALLALIVTGMYSSRVCTAADVGVHNAILPSATNRPGT